MYFTLQWCFQHLVWMDRYANKMISKHCSLSWRYSPQHLCANEFVLAEGYGKALLWFRMDWFHRRGAERDCHGTHTWYGFALFRVVRYRTEAGMVKISHGPWEAAPDLSPFPPHQEQSPCLWAQSLQEQDSGRRCMTSPKGQHWRSCVKSRV